LDEEDDFDDDMMYGDETAATGADET